MNNTATSSSNNDRWSRFGSACRRAFHVYAAWLVSITWWRFFWLSLLLLIGMGIVHDIPPFSWTYSEVISPSALPRKISKKPPVPRAANKDGVDISIDERGVHISTRSAPPALPASDSAAPATPASAPEVTIKLPP